MSRSLISDSFAVNENLALHPIFFLLRILLSAMEAPLTEKEVVRARIFALECKEHMDRDDWAEWGAMQRVLDKLYKEDSNDGIEVAP